MQESVTSKYKLLGFRHEGSHHLELRDTNDQQ